MIEYKLIRSAKRRTITIIIEHDGSVTVRCGARTSQADVDKFVLKRSGWIYSKVNEIKSRSQKLGDVYALKKILVCGKMADFSIGLPEIFSLNQVRCRSLSSLQTLFVKNLGGEFISIFKELASAGGFKYKSVGFKSYKSRWGCCFSDGRIYFNYKLLMLDKALWKAVAVHELCHTLYMDHSKKFHAAVNAAMSEYEAVHSGLSEYSGVCSLY